MSRPGRVSTLPRPAPKNLSSSQPRRSKKMLSRACLVFKWIFQKQTLKELLHTECFFTFPSVRLQSKSHQKSCKCQNILTQSFLGRNGKKPTLYLNKSYASLFQTKSSTSREAMVVMPRTQMRWQYIYKYKNTDNTFTGHLMYFGGRLPITK